MSELVAFVRARLNDDEAALQPPDWYCTDSARGEGWGTRGDECPICGKYMFDGTETATKEAWQDHMAEYHGRVLAQVAAMRRILDEATSHYGDFEFGGHGEYGDSGEWAFETALLALASVWADHPDWRKEWDQ